MLGSAQIDRIHYDWFITRRLVAVCAGMFHARDGQEATKIVQCDHRVASDVFVQLSSPGAHRTLPDTCGDHAYDPAA